MSALAVALWSGPRRPCSSPMAICRPTSAFCFAASRCFAILALCCSTTTKLVIDSISRRTKAIRLNAMTSAKPDRAFVVIAIGVVKRILKNFRNPHYSMWIKKINAGQRQRYVLSRREPRLPPAWITATCELSATPIGSVGGVYLDGFALFDEEWHLYGESSLECGGLLHVACCVAFDAFGGFSDLHFNRCG